MTSIKQELPQEQRLRPLRDVGLLEKTQCWDIEDIQAALRQAYVQGVSVESLYGTASGTATADAEETVNGRIVTPTPAPKVLSPPKF